MIDLEAGQLWSGKERHKLVGRSGWPWTWSRVESAHVEERAVHRMILLSTPVLVYFALVRDLTAVLGDTADKGGYVADVFFCSEASFMAWISKANASISYDPG